MPGEFDMDAAVAEIGAGLGFGDDNNDAGGSDAGKSLEHPDDDTAGAGADAGAVADGATAEEGKPAPEAVEGEAGEAAAEGAPKATPSADDPPSTWRDGVRAKWAAVDPEVKAEILKREQDFFKGIEGYKGDAAIGKDLKQVLEPFIPAMQKFGVNPYQQIRSLMTAHHQLALGSPQEKMALFQQLAKDYGVDLSAAGGEAPYVDPEVIRLREEQNRLQSTVSNVTAQLTQQRHAELRTTIDKFANDPANVHFKEVASDMAVLLKTGASPSIEDAYQKAVWQNPITRAKEITRQQADLKAAAAKKEADRVAAARKATSANTRSSGQGRSTTPTGTMDDTLNETLAKIKARG